MLICPTPAMQVSSVFVSRHRHGLDGCLKSSLGGDPKQVMSAGKVMGLIYLRLLSVDD